MTCVLPDPGVMAFHCEWLAAPALRTDRSLRLEVAWSEPGQGPSHARTFPLDQAEDAAGFGAWINGQGCNVYLGATLKRADTPFKGRTKARHAAFAACLPIDIDGEFQPGLQKLESVVKAQLIVITGTAPEPRGQVWVRTTATDDMTLWEELNRRSVHFCGGDRNALGTYRLMRLAGSVSYPPPRKQQRGYITELTTISYHAAPEYSLQELLDAFPPVEEIKPPEIKTLTPHSRQQRRIPVNTNNVAIILSMLTALPDEYADSYDLWLRVGFALHSFDPDDIGLALWVKFSERSYDKAEVTDFHRIWVGFERPYDGDKITLGWLKHHAQQHGWRMPRSWDFSHEAGTE